MIDKYRIDLLKQEVDKKAFLAKINFDKKKTEKRLTTLEKDLESNFKDLKIINNMLDEEMKKTDRERLSGFYSMKKKLDNLKSINNDINKKLSKCLYDKEVNNKHHLKTKKDLDKCISSKNSSIFHKYAVMKSQVKKNITS